MTMTERTGAPGARPASVGPDAGSFADRLRCASVSERSDLGRCRGGVGHPGPHDFVPTELEVKPTKPEPRYANGYGELGRGIGELVEQKQAAYGDSFGKSGQIFRLLYPDGIPPSKIDDALVVVRVVDKLFRIATDRDALGESPWRDVAGYALLATKRVEDSR